MNSSDLLTTFTNLASDGTRPLSPELFEASCEIDAGSILQTPGELLDHLQTRNATIVNSVADRNSFAIVFDSVDEITGLTIRESWSFRVSNGRIRNIFGCAGFSFRKPVQRPAGEVDYYLRGFDLRRPEEDDRETLLTAQRAVSTIIGRQADFDFVDSLVNDELVYVPYSWIGCNGFLFDRQLEVAIQLGSAIPVHVHIWAFYRGFADRKIAADRHNDLVITAVRDRDSAVQVLRKHFLALPALENLPVRLSNVDLYFQRYDLWMAELRRIFEFQVEPPTTGGLTQQ